MTDDLWPFVNETEEKNPSTYRLIPFIITSSHSSTQPRATPAFMRANVARVAASREAKGTKATAVVSGMGARRNVASVTILLLAKQAHVHVNGLIQTK